MTGKTDRRFYDSLLSVQDGYRTCTCESLKWHCGDTSVEKAVSVAFVWDAGQITGCVVAFSLFVFYRRCSLSNSYKQAGECVGADTSTQ